MGGRSTPPWDKEAAPAGGFPAGSMAKLSGYAYLPNITYVTLSVREAGALVESRRRSACLAFHNMRGCATK